MSEWRRSVQTTRRDANEPALMKAMARLGIYFHPRVGPLDGWAFHRGVWMPAEIKTPTGQRTRSQKEFMTDCDQMQAPYGLWRTEDDIVNFANRSTLGAIG